ncbi:calpain-like [Littorina saxatilis]|uniref:calpain-like n=1 Tax=Littorina saxatilis TaxID=31220 RepID=UPI0038B4A591
MADPRCQYAGTTTGLMVQFLDFRLRDDGRSMPMVPPSQLWEDTTFDLQDAIPDPQIAQRVEWNRPGEISDHPQLFTDGTTRFDIGQGEAGTCWLLSMVASIAPHARLLQEVRKGVQGLFQTTPTLSEAGPTGGMFHASFWRFGQLEDVYVDDRLPVLKGSKQLWGAHSASDPNEFWVALLEKAFARSGEWEGVSTGEVPRAVKDEGEFWICLDDFMIYFNEPTVCSLTPDFDQDGVSDSQNFVTNVYGEWRGETAAGFQNKLKNPRLKFTVPQ